MKRNSDKYARVKPFLKWAGGKSQLLDKFLDLYPIELKNGTIKHYFEPFIGAGAVFFDIIQRYEIEKAWLYDINEELILIYKAIQTDVTGLIDILSGYEKDYLKLNNTSREIYYYKLRESLNQNLVKTNYKNYSKNWNTRASQLIFLNRTCYNGLFRFNRNGMFNAPWGDYKKPRICNTDNLLNASRLLQIAEIKCCGFEEVLKDIQLKSFVYLDPPYRPISKTSGFTSYSKHQFTDDNQIKLAKIFTRLDNKGCKVMLSNSDPKNTNKTDTFFDDLYKNYPINRIPARRSINSDISKRGILNEIVVSNYKP